MCIEEKYNIIYMNNKRYYVVSLDERPLMENTVPYSFEYKGIKVYDSAWNRITVKILECIDKLNPKNKEELLKLEYTWSKTSVFSNEKKTNFLPFKDIYVNTNHTAIHAFMNIQLLLSAYGIDLKECSMIIRRHPSAEPSDARNYYREQTISGFKRCMMLSGFSQKKIDIVLNNFNIINIKFLRAVSSGFDDFYLFDDYTYFQSYMNKTIEYVNKKYYGTPYVIATVNGLKYLDSYYKNKSFFDKYNLKNVNTEVKEEIANEINVIIEKMGATCISASKLYSRIKITKAYLLDKCDKINNHEDFFILVSLILKDRFDFNKPFIFIKGKEGLKNDDIIIANAYSKDVFTIKDLNSFSDAMHLKRIDNYLKFIDDCSNDYVQVDVGTFISKSSFNISKFELQKIEREVKFYINSFGDMKLDSYNDYDVFPKLEKNWNNYLLAGIIRSYLNDTFEIKYTSNTYNKTNFIITLKAE